MKVKALKLGYYNHKRVKEGSVITLLNSKDFSEVWMKALGEEVASAKSAPVKVSPSKKKGSVEVAPEQESETEKEVI